MRAFRAVVVALLLSAILAVAGVVSAQSTVPLTDLLTTDDLSQTFEGLWTGACTPFGDSVACSFGQTPDEGGGQVGLVMRIPVPGSGASSQTLEEWRAAILDVARATGHPTEPVPDVGDEAYLVNADPTYQLEFFAGGMTGSLQAIIPGASPGADMADIARIALSRLGVAPGARSPGPQVSIAPLPTAAPITTLPPEPSVGPTQAPVGPSADQLLTAADLSAVAGGAWSGDCTRSTPMVTCMFAQSGGATRIGLSVDESGASTGVPTPESWRQSVTDAATATSATMTAVPNLGDEAYAVQGVGVSSLEFYVGGVTGRLDAADATPAIDAALPDLARLAIQRLGVTAPAPSPTPTPSPLPPPTTRPTVGPVQAPGPGDISLDPVVIATSAVAAAGIVLLIPFPSALFNSTLEENYDEIRGWFRWRRRRRPGDGPTTPPTPPTPTTPASGFRAALDRFWATRLGVATFFLVAGVMYGFLDPTFGVSVNSLLLLVGILAALAIGSLAATATFRWARERLNGERGTFRVLPATLIVALVCVLVTRITDFQPGYLYGVLAGLLFVVVVPERATGREHALASSIVAALGVAAFVILGIVRALEGSGGATGAWRPIDVALSALVIGGIEGLLFGMLPLSGLPGAKVKEWDTRIWAVLLFLGTVGFLHVIVNPSSGYLVDTTTVPLVKALALLVLFGGVSVGLWAWFRYRPMDRWRERQAGMVEAAGPTATPAETGGPDDDADG